ncbi:MAG TPA: hypothetical protein VGN37_13390 [Actinocatenispora sp.]
MAGRIPPLAAVLVGVLLGTLGWTVYVGFEAVVYLGGERTVAHVDGCETHSTSHGGSSTVCHGTWRTADGATHHGTVEGAGGSDEGGDLPVRALGGVAAVASPLGLVIELAFECVLVLASSALAVAVALSRRRRRAFAPPPYAYPHPRPPMPPRRWR